MKLDESAMDQPEDMVVWKAKPGEVRNTEPGSCTVRRQPILISLSTVSLASGTHLVYTLHCKGRGGDRREQVGKAG